MSSLCGQRRYSESKRDLTQQTCFGTFIKKQTQDNKTSNSSHHTCHGCLYQKHHFMQRQEKDPLGQVCLHFASSEWHEKGNLSSALLPDTVPWLRQLWGLRRKLSVASTEAPDFSSSATTSSRPSSAARCSGVGPRPGEAAARLAPRVKA